MLIPGADSLDLYHEDVCDGSCIELPDLGCKLLSKAIKAGGAVIVHEMKRVHRRGNEDNQPGAREVLEKEYVCCC